MDLERPLNQLITKIKKVKKKLKQNSKTLSKVKIQISCKKCLILSAIERSVFTVSSRNKVGNENHYLCFFDVAVEEKLR